MRCAVSPNDPRIGDLVLLLDDEGSPYAETCRKVGEAAERLGCLRPSYAHVRRLVRLHRRAQELRRRGRAVFGEPAQMVAVGRVPSLVEAFVRANELHGHAELVLQQHKALARRGRTPGTPGSPGGGERGEREEGRGRGDAGATAPARRSRGP